MTKRLNRRVWCWAMYGLLAAVLLTAMPAAPVAAAPMSQAGGFLVFGGTVVNANRLNVRAAPAVNAAALGKLNAGERVYIVGRSSSWYLIRYAGAPSGLGWVNASYIQIDGQPVPAVVVQPPPAPVARPVAAPPAEAAPAAPAAPPSIWVETPNLIDFYNGVFRWQWSSDPSRLAGIDWYTDLLLFFKGEPVPYRVFVAEPAAVQQDGSYYSWSADPFRVQCGTEVVARIAVRSGGTFAGWVSGASTPLDVGPACSAPVAVGGGGDGGGDGGGGDGGGGGGGGGGSCPYPPALLDAAVCSRPDIAAVCPCR